ncbi:2-keto-4-pentenoate hydratase [Limosilactobacillus sp. STM2_1]|uniref:2-keto-4-pentenoate hydratase n=1 Tax=Limosilactobacillus rudii TaxID=2759755 RepID=A0A7W3ULH7_9LACO|nr:2-keto-4-pentenoate hydratase [Limosilactobacillus rudii]MBB1079608.1 2-keto-4-pentenoate hydratase [Limosilactobacillus rudii]MBB1097686.1 2-keto-4-pentenoate hydratase [Limosilactobacillus rudii]MCD7134795.1 2-keto-4-pentenoate hydratase [Limosilactobacillus rudii]
MTKLTAKQEEFAKALFKAYDTNTPLNEEDWQGVVKDDDTAYAVQDEVVKLKGKPTAGYKVSLTSKETQDMFDADSPLYGQQVAERFLQAPADVELKDLNEPLLEVELAFRAKEDLKPTDSLDDLFHKVTVAGDLELPDARFVDWFPDLGKYNVMSDCAVGGLVVYGEERDADQAFDRVDDAANVHAVLYKDGEKLKEGVSSEVLGNPFKSLQWLVQKLADQGKTFKKGQMVSSGTFVLPPKLTAGKWEVKFDNGFGDVVVNAR